MERLCYQTMAMLFDAYALRAACLLVEGLAGARVQKIQQPDGDRLLLALHPDVEGRRLLLVAGRQAAGLSMSARRDVMPSSPLHFCQGARAHLRNARLVTAEQLGLDRTLRLVFEASSAVGGGRRSVVGELFGARPNLFLLDGEDRVLVCLHHYPADGRSRPGALWEAPSPRGGVPPWELDRAAFGAAWRGEGDGPNPRGLVGVVAGLHPRRAEALLGGIVDEDEAWQRFAAFAEALHTGRFHAALDDDGLLEIAPCDDEAPIAPAALAELLDGLLHGAGSGDRGDELRRSLSRSIEKALGRLERERGHVEEGLTRSETAPAVRLQAEALKQALGQARKGATELVVERVWTAEGAVDDVRVPLDPRLSSRENMDRLFARARKLERSRDTLETRLLHLLEERERLDGLRRRVDGAAGLDELEELRKALAATSRVKAPRAAARGAPRKAADERFRRFRSSDGLVILVGRNNRENDALLKEKARKLDFWLHAKDVPGAHVLVVLASGQDSPPETTLVEAAQLALHFSKNRYAGKGEVMLARARDVGKFPGAAPGRVRVESFRALHVPTDPEIVARLSPTASLNLSGPSTDEHARLATIPTREGFHS